jgi:hypothetical protein
MKQSVLMLVIAVQALMISLNISFLHCFAMATSAAIPLNSEH